jgi:hypothetical protein
VPQPEDTYEAPEICELDVTEGPLETASMISLSDT